MGIDTISYAIGKKSVPPAPKVLLEEKTISISSNGQSTVSPSTGYDGLSSVVVNIAVPTREVIESTPVDVNNDGIIYLFNQKLDDLYAFTPAAPSNNYALALSVFPPCFIIDLGAGEMYHGEFTQVSGYSAFQFFVPNPTDIVADLPLYILAVRAR